MPELYDARCDRLRPLYTLEYSRLSRLGYDSFGFYWVLMAVCTCSTYMNFNGEYTPQAALHCKVLTKMELITLFSCRNTRSC